VLVLRQFPDVQDARQARPFLEAWWNDTIVVHARAREQRYDSHPGPLSVKFAFGGRETYRFEGRELDVHDGCWLALPHGTVYSSEIDAAHPVESLCVMFPAAQVSEAATFGDDAILDHARLRPPSIFPQLHPARGAVYRSAVRLRDLRDAHSIEEELHALLAELLRTQEGIERAIAALPARRASTRAELYRRLQRARDLIESRFDQPLRIRDMARAACLQDHHFLREFTRAFRVTPYRYLVRRRLEAAHVMLRRGGGVMEACLRSGFADPSAFGRAFRMRFGQAPSAVRPKNTISAGPGPARRT
jgi:AraC family transcriptional regulator